MMKLGKFSDLDETTAQSLLDALPVNHIGQAAAHIEIAKHLWHDRQTDPLDIVDVLRDARDELTKAIDNILRNRSD